MSSKTPIRIRGKRSAPKDQKWHSGKQRKAPRPGSITQSDADSSVRSTPSAGAVSRRRRKARDGELSQLEQLPTEILQAIFEYSANMDLPLASPRLASQLASQHLYHSLTSIALASLFDLLVSATTAKQTELQTPMRLMNSKFFTWPFFKSWLIAELEQRNLRGNKNGSDTEEEALGWCAMLLDTTIPPPTKLLRGPFTREKIRLLQFLTHIYGRKRGELSPSYVEKAQEGARQAVSEGANDAIGCFWTLGALPDTELLREAVIDSGCKKHVVIEIIDLYYKAATSRCPIDFLDPVLWSWAERAQANGDEKGPWLKDLLRSAAGRVGQEVAQKPLDARA